jgi:hypothetical protein
LVNAIPWIRYVPDRVPGTGWKEVVKELRKKRDIMIGTLFGYTKQKIVCTLLYYLTSNRQNKLPQKAEGTAPHSALKSHLAELEVKIDPGVGYAEREDRIKWVIGTLFGGKA